MFFRSVNKVEIHRDVSFLLEDFQGSSGNEKIKDKTEFQVLNIQQDEENLEEEDNGNNNLEQMNQGHVEEREDAAQEPQEPDARNPENRAIEEEQPVERIHRLCNREYTEINKVRSIHK